MTMTRNLETPFTTKTWGRPQVAAMTPPSTGPTIWPRRMDEFRMATTRPRFSGVLMSAMTTWEVVCHIETPVLPMSSTTKNAA